MIQFRGQKQNVALTNHIIRIEQVFDRDICELKCYQDPNCVSYNYGPSADGNLLCELSDKTHLQVPANDLKAKEDFTYSLITAVSNVKVLRNVWSLTDVVNLKRSMEHI